MTEFDYGYAGQIWALAFSSVVGLYVLAHVIGVILRLIRES